MTTSASGPSFYAISRLTRNHRPSPSPMALRRFSTRPRAPLGASCDVLSDVELGKPQTCANGHEIPEDLALSH